jgi:hypothetical protein
VSNVSNPQDWALTLTNQRDSEQRRAEHLKAALLEIKHRAVGEVPEIEAPQGNRLQRVWAIATSVLDNAATTRDVCPLSVSTEMASALRALLHNMAQHSCSGCHIEKAREALAFYEDTVSHRSDQFVVSALPNIDVGSWTAVSVIAARNPTTSQLRPAVMLIMRRGSERQKVAFNLEQGVYIGGFELDHAVEYRTDVLKIIREAVYAAT